MKRSLLFACILPAALLAGGCGAQTALLGVEEYLFTTSDALARPGEAVDLSARLQGGDLLQPKEGLLVRFQRPGQPVRLAETDGDGRAVVSFVPPAAGNYAFRAEVAPAGLAERPPARELLVACRTAEEPMVIVDLDHTVVGEGFEKVLVGDPAPMDRSVEVLKRLAGKHTIVYLTHRPDLFGPKSKAWLARHDYPSGPVLLSSIRGFLKGSGEFKTEMLRNLRRRFERVEIGIGDKISDARAYHDNGMTSILINKNNEAEATSGADGVEKLENLREHVGRLEDLPEGVHVVRSWEQVAAVIWGGKTYPPAQTVKRLRKRLDELEKQVRRMEDDQ